MGIFGSSTSPKAPRKDAIREADAIRRGVWARIAGEERIPVDPFRICLALGLDAFLAELPPTMAGAIRRVPGTDPTILINRDDSDVRQRFTCAHELGHWVDRLDTPDESYEFVDLRDTLAAAGTDEREIWANRFAANLLMPADHVRRHAKEATSVIDLAFTFGVSAEAMTVRLRSLGITVG